MLPRQAERPPVPRHKLVTVRTTQVLKVAATVLRQQLTRLTRTPLPATVVRLLPATRLHQLRTRSHKVLRSTVVRRSTAVARLPPMAFLRQQAQVLTQAPRRLVLRATHRLQLRPEATRRPRLRSRLTHRPATTSRTLRILRPAATRAPRLRTQMITRR